MDYFRDRFIDELNEAGEIEIAGYVWPRYEVLETMDAKAANEVFLGWVDDAKQAAVARTRDFLTETDCINRFRALSHRVKQSSVIPFIGAGMSASSGFPLWAPFLQSLVEAPSAVATAVEAHITLGEYEEAAQKVRGARGDAALAEEIYNRFGSHWRDVKGPVQLLPEVFQAEVITTNFDYGLPRAYEAAKRPFAATFCGPELRTAPQRIGDDPRCLLRLHGQADTDLGRVLTLAEYQSTYVANRTLAGVLSAIVSLRSLLFMGCSLNQDRTVSALRELSQAAEVDPPRHYAFLRLPEPEHRQQRLKFLSEAGIYPIYYPGDDHDQYIEDMLITLMEGGLD